LKPGSINTFAGSVTFTLDIRHPNDDALEKMESACRSDFDKIAKEESEQGCTLDWKLLTPSPAVKFHPDCIGAVEASTIEVCGDSEAAGLGKKEGKLWKHMTSGAGHDSCYTSKRIPTSMIFVPCKNGISHNPEEYCGPEDWYVHLFVHGLRH
jgi:acetylornithine deacetylase/succinyl-diaminopimelate desuccinylase-like protein